MDQDPLGIQGFKYTSKDGVEVWFKPLTGEAWAMCVLNRNKESRQFTFDWSREGVADDLSKRKGQFDSKVYRVKNLWTATEMGTSEILLTAEIPGRDVLMIRLDPKSLRPQPREQSW